VSSRLIAKGYKVNVRYQIDGYPEVDKILGPDRGYALDDHILFEEDTKLVVVIGLGSNCGKLSTCLGQVYLDNVKLKQDSGYAKYELFPIWNLPVDHPTALAYEAATADIADVVLEDPYHLAAYHLHATNYNRDVNAFPLLAAIMQRAASEANPIRQYKFERPLPPLASFTIPLLFLSSLVIFCHFVRSMKRNLVLTVPSRFQVPDGHGCEQGRVCHPG
jgi:uncharacterized protein (UPF0371 family)